MAQEGPSPAGHRNSAPGDERGEDDEAQSGLGRGLDAILTPMAPRPVSAAVAPPGTSVGGRGLEALFGVPPPPQQTGLAPPPLRRPSMPLPVGAPPEPGDVERRLAVLVKALALDVAAHARAGPDGPRLQLLRPAPRDAPPSTFDQLCGAVRAFVADGDTLTDDFDADGCPCVAFGPRPLTFAGIYVLGRRLGALTPDERWYVHGRLALGEVGRTGLPRPAVTIPSAPERRPL